MKKINFTLFIALIISFHCYSQFKLSPADSIRRDSINRVTQQDYNKMLAHLNINSTRLGPSGNPSAPNAANTDESKASPYTSLPDPLTLKNGGRVTDAKTWWEKRRPEIVEDFDSEIYGRVPNNLPKVTWEVVSATNDTSNHVAAITKKLIGHVDNSAYPSITVNIDLTLTTPANAKGAVPVIMEFGFVFPPGFRLPSPPAGIPVEKNWQQQLLEKGWGYAVLIPASYQADNGAGLTEGIIGLVNKGQPRKPDDWGTLRAWAWGASVHWIISKQIKVWTQNTSVLKVSRAMAKQPLLRWLTSLDLPLPLWVHQVQAEQKFCVVFLVSRLRILHHLASTIGSPATL